MSKKFLLFYFLSITFLFSCTTGFKMIADKSNIKGHSLAVIAGLKNDETKLYAEFLTTKLQKESNFNVLSQDQIKKQLNIYPLAIKGPYSKFSVEEILEDYNNTDIEKIKEIQQKLNVDNIIVIWAPIHLVYKQKGATSDLYEIHAINQFFSFPGAKEVGRGKIKTMYATGLVIGAKVPRNMNMAIQNGTDVLAKNIIEETGMAK